VFQRWLLGGQPPDPRDFLRHSSRVRLAGEEGAPRSLREAGPAPSAHGRPGYPLPGCVPAEPGSVSPSVVMIPDGFRWRQAAEGDAPPEVPVDWFWKENRSPEASNDADQDCAQSCSQSQGVCL
jgi:hypothetical protein